MPKRPSLGDALKLLKECEGFTSPDTPESTLIDISTYTFEKFTQFVFDHPPGDKDWYFRKEWEYEITNPQIMLKYTIGLFNKSDSLLKSYSSEQIDIGFWFITGSEGWLNLLWEKIIPLSLRISVIESMENLFKLLFATNPIGTIDFMWWDILVEGYWLENGKPQDEDDAEIQQAMFNVICHILKFSSRACQESALHGLGHLHHPETAKVINEFLEANPNIDEKLKAYAIECREGAMQ